MLPKFVKKKMAATTTPTKLNWWCWRYFGFDFFFFRSPLNSSHIFSASCCFEWRESMKMINDDDIDFFGFCWFFFFSSSIQLIIIAKRFFLCVYISHKLRHPNVCEYIDFAGSSFRFGCFFHLPFGVCVFAPTVSLSLC